MRIYGCEIDPVRNRLAAPLLMRRLELLDKARSQGRRTRHVYVHGRGYGELLALAVALDRGYDFAKVVRAHDMAIAACECNPFATA